MVLISYIAYNKGLDKNKQSTTTTTTEKNTVEKINKLYLYEDLCDSDPCDKEIIELNDLKINFKSKKEEENIVHNIVFSGKVNKTIEMKEFVNIQILDSNFFIIEEHEKDEINTLTLYDKDITKLDQLEINNLLDKSFKNLEMTFYTYDVTCEEEDNKHFIKNSALVSSDGFNLLSTSKGPLKETGFKC